MLTTGGEKAVSRRTKEAKQVFYRGAVEGWFATAAIDACGRGRLRSLGTPERSVAYVAYNPSNRQAVISSQHL